MTRPFANPALHNLLESFERLYGQRAALCLARVQMMAGRYGIGFDLSHPPSLWSQSNSVLIAYGDMLHAAGEKPLAVLDRFACRRLGRAFNTIHLLPIFPYSSDDGFSVIHFRAVNPDMGGWEDVQRIGKHFRLMLDLVLNHVSRRSGWFRDYETRVAPGRDYFLEADPSADLSAVARPRSTPLLTPVQTLSGVRHLWTTFGPDQLDLNYGNPDVLFEMLDIILFYVSMGARIIRLDAIAYVWKRIGSGCINLPETHEIVRIFRSVLDLVAPYVALLTETNIPHEENISYFGSGDEAQLVYQFSLPPLVLQALLTGNARFLTDWAVSLADPPPGCYFLNFTASHDGIGVRPLEGLVPEDAINELLENTRRRGGRISSRLAPDGSEVPYEMNITYFDALSFPGGGRGDMHVARFICSQAIALSMKGIPAVYFNSLVAATNDYVLAKQTGQARSLNRTKWEETELNDMLDDTSTVASRVFNEYIRLLKIRAEHPAFHPEAEQRILDLGNSVFALERISKDRKERILAVHNVSESEVFLSSDPLRDHDFDIESGSNVIGEDPDSAGAGLRLAPYEVAWLCFE